MLITDAPTFNLIRWFVSRACEMIIPNNWWHVFCGPLKWWLWPFHFCHMLGVHIFSNSPGYSPTSWILGFAISLSWTKATLFYNNYCMDPLQIYIGMKGGIYARPGPLFQYKLASCQDLLSSPCRRINWEGVTEKRGKVFLKETWMITVVNGLICLLNTNLQSKFGSWKDWFLWAHICMENLTIWWSSNGSC